MLLERGKVNKISAQNEGRDLIFDGLFGVGRGLFDDSTYLLKNMLHFLGEVRNVFVDGVPGFVFGFHFV